MLSAIPNFILQIKILHNVAIELSNNLLIVIANRYGDIQELLITCWVMSTIYNQQGILSPMGYYKDILTQIQQADDSAYENNISLVECDDLANAELQQLRNYCASIEVENTELRKAITKSKRKLISGLYSKNL